MLASLSLLVPSEVELDVFAFFLVLKGHVIIDGVLARARVFFIAQNNPCGTFVAIILREGFIPDVFEPEAGHVELIKCLY